MAPRGVVKRTEHLSFLLFFFLFFYYRINSTRNAAHDATRHHTLPKVRALETHPKLLNAHKVARRILQGPSRSSPVSTSTSFLMHGSCIINQPAPPPSSSSPPHALARRIHPALVHAVPTLQRSALAEARRVRAGRGVLAGPPHLRRAHPGCGRECERLSEELGREPSRRGVGLVG